MPHSFTKIWIHAVWGTKDFQPLIRDTYKNKLYDHIKNQLNECECNPEAIGGTNNHLHVLFRLSPDASISRIVKAVKGESSHWINQNKLLNTKFSWQVGYAAFSVSESGIKKAVDYITNQHEHHRKKSFLEEFNLFLKKYGFDQIA